MLARTVDSINNECARKGGAEKSDSDEEKISRVSSVAVDVSVNKYFHLLKSRKVLSCFQTAENEKRVRLKTFVITRLYLRVPLVAETQFLQ